MRINRRWISTAIALSLSWAGNAYAEDYYWKSTMAEVWALDFKTESDACVATYQAYGGVIAAPGVAQLPYQAPVPTNPVPFKNALFACPLGFVYKGNVTTTMTYLIRYGDGCKEGELYNPVTEKCQNKNEDQDDKEMGDPDRKSSQGVVYCGNPVNIGAGNKFQKEIDYVDEAGYLRFERYFNGLDGRWRHSYQAALYQDQAAYAVSLSDGEVVLFKRIDQLFQPEAAGVGSMSLDGDVTNYNDPDGNTFGFDAQGRLIAQKDNLGRVTTLVYQDAGNGATRITVTDAYGKTAEIVESKAHDLRSIQVGDLSVTYDYDEKSRLTSATRTRGNHSVRRTYLYEDARNAAWLTGLMDERGIRYATWTYDDQGRAVSSEHAGGTEKVTMTYEPDGSVTVANALGHTTRYRYQVVQGMKRIVAIDGEPTAGCPASNTRYTYTTDGQIATRTDALGHVTAYTYDTLGRETKQVEGQGSAEERTTSTTWDGTSFRPATVTTADRVTSYTYDAQGRPLSTTTRSLKD